MLRISPDIKLAPALWNEGGGGAGLKSDVI